jgi:hypothetical protein
MRGVCRGGLLLALWGWGGFGWRLRRGPCRRFFTWHCWPLCGTAFCCHVMACRRRFPGLGSPARAHASSHVGVSCSTLLAPVRGGTSFLFPTAKKKRSKENAYKRQPVASALAQPRPWPESRTVPAVQRAIENPSCFTRQCTLRPHGRIYSAASALVSASVLSSALISVPILVSALVLVSAWISVSVRVVLDLGFDLDLGVAAPARPGVFSDHVHRQCAFAVVLTRLFTVA